jgi:ATP/maltotriose-dependent transcriptional regulator MalT
VAVLMRHLDFYVALAEQAERELEGRGLFTWLQRLDLELGNLRAALDWSVQTSEANKALRVATSLRLFWTRHGDLSEGCSRFEAALSLPGVDPLLRASALATAAELLSNKGDLVGSRAFAQEALGIARSLGDIRVMGRALGMAGFAATFLDPPSARAVLEEAIELSREAGDTYYLTMNLRNLGQELWQVGQLAQSRTLFEEALAVARPAGNQIGIEISLGQLALGLGFAGELAQAEAAFLESLDIARELNDRFILGVAMAGLAGVATHRGEYARAIELLDESMVQAQQSSPFVVAVALLYRGLLEYARGDLGDSRMHLVQAVNMTRVMRTAFAHSWGLRMLADVEHARGELEAARACVDEALEVAHRTGGFSLGLVLRSAGRLARSQGDNERAESFQHEALELFKEASGKLDTVEALEALAGLAAVAESHAEAGRLFGAAEALRESIGSVRFPVDRETYENDIAVVREGLTDEEFQRAWEEGRAMSMEEAVAYASRGRGERKRPSAGWASLTPSELQVVRLVAEGLSNPRIGERLFISRRTVQTHLQHVFTKLGVTSRAELAAQATRKQI